MAYTQQLYRSKEHRVIGGVAGGLADYFRMDVSLIRIFWILAVLFGGGGVLAYLIAWLVIPEASTVHIHQEKLDFQASEAYRRPLRMDPSKLSLVGCLLIGLGLFFLIKDRLPWHISQYIWPLFLIGFGIFLLIKRNRV